MRNCSFLNLDGCGFAVKGASSALWSPHARVLVGQDTRLLTQHEEFLASLFFIVAVAVRGILQLLGASSLLGLNIFFSC